MIPFRNTEEFSEQVVQVTSAIIINSHLSFSR